jgi:hypothetical protein
VLAYARNLLEDPWPFSGSLLDKPSGRCEKLGRPLFECLIRNRAMPSMRSLGTGCR